MNLKHTILLTILLAVGCIKNDIPYPIRKSFITDIEFRGQKSVEIKDNERIVNVVLDEVTDIQNVDLVKFVTTENTTVTPSVESLPMAIDLSSEFSFTLSTYQDYIWKIVAKQPIERSASVDGQIGDAIFDEKNHTATIYVSQKTDKSKIQVNHIKFASEVNSTVSPDPKTVTDFTNPVKFNVKQHGRTVEWTVEVLSISITTDDAEVWAKRAVLKGLIEDNSSSSAGFYYKKVGDNSFTKQTDVEKKGGVITAVIATEPNTSYTYYVYQDDDNGKEVTFTTESAPLIPNSSFQDWYLKGKTWYPCLESEYGDKEKYVGFWNTGNSGVTITSPTSNVRPIDDGLGRKEVLLETVKIMFVGMGAGSLFAGNFITDLSEPLNSPKFGRPFTGRPTKFTGRYKYFPTKITNPGKRPEMVQYEGQLDRCMVWINLEDWGEGVTVRPKDPTIIARGTFQEYGTVSEYKDFEVLMDYRIKDRKPTHICIVFSSSEFGDFYTGGIGTKFYIDQFQIEY